MEANLKVVVGADVSQAVNGLRQVEQSTQKMADTSRQGAFALNSLSQVARDLPFGFIAIQNNLPIVVDQFGALARSSGGVGGALKAIGGAVLGPAGVSFAFGAAISVTTALIQKYGSLGNALTALFEKTDALSRSKKTLATVFKEGNTEAAKDIANLNILVGISNDVKNSIDNRREAAKKLISTYGEYLPNVNEEAILNGKAADAINRAKDALINKALAQASENKLAEIGGKLLGNQLAQVKAAKDLLEVKKQAQEQDKKQFSGNSSDRDLVGQNFLQAQIRLESARQKFEELRKDGKDLSTQYDELTNAAVRFARAAGDGFIKDEKVKPEGTKSKLAKATEDAKELVRQLQIIDGFDLDKTFLKNFGPDKGNLDPSKGSGNFRDTSIKAPTTIKFFKTPEIEEQNKQLMKMQELASGLAKEFSGNLGNAIATFVDELISGKDAGEDLFKNLANGLKAVALQFVAIVVEALALYALSQVWKPLDGLLQGLGAAGQLASAFSGKKHASGGVATEATWGMIGEAGPEAIIPLSQLAYFTRQMSPQVGGSWQSGGVQVSGVLVGRGNDLLAVVNSAGRTANRSF